MPNRPRAIDRSDLIARKELFSPGEAAYILGRSRSTIYEKLASGELRSVRDGGRRYITAAEIKRYIANLEANGDE